MKNKRSQFYFFGIIALVAAAFIMSFFQKYLTTSKAAGEKALFTMSPSSGAINVSQQKNITVTIVPDSAAAAFSGIDITFKTSGVLDIKDVTLVSALAGGTTTSANSTQLIKTIQPKQARISQVFLESTANLPRVITFQVTVQATQTGNGDLSVDSTNSQIVGNITGNVYAIGGTIQGSYTVGGVSGPSIAVRVTPAQANVSVGSSLPVKLIIDGQQAGNKVSGFDIHLNVDPAALSVVSVSDPVDNDTGGDGTKFTKLAKDINATTGDIHLNYVSILPTDQLPNHPAISFQLQGKAAGTGSVTISSAQITGNIAENSYAVTSTNGTYVVGGQGSPTPTDNPNITPTPGGTGNMTLAMQLKFQGIVKQPAAQTSMKVQVTIGKTGFRSQPQFGTFTSDANGIWSGSVTFPDVPPGDGYSIYVKGPKHLQKRICDPNPFETSPATYRCANGAISLQDGVNTFDFSNVYLLSGDLPEQNGEQNGIVDAYDLAYVRLSLGNRDTKSLSVADLNLDGIVDTQDYSLVIAALNVKYDEL